MPAAVHSDMPQPTAAHEIPESPCSSAQRVDIAATQVSCGLLREASAVIKLSSTSKLLNCTCRPWWHLQSKTGLNCMLQHASIVVPQHSLTNVHGTCSMEMAPHLTPGMIQEEILHAGLPLHSSHACHI